MNSIKENFAKLIAEIQSDQSQTEFIKDLEYHLGKTYSRQTIYRWIRGESSPHLTVELIRALAALSAMSIEELLQRLGFPLAARNQIAQVIEQPPIYNQLPNQLPKELAVLDMPVCLSRHNEIARHHIAHIEMLNRKGDIETRNQAFFMAFSEIDGGGFWNDMFRFADYVRESLSQPDDFALYVAKSSRLVAARNEREDWEEAERLIQDIEQIAFDMKNPVFKGISKVMWSNYLLHRHRWNFPQGLYDSKTLLEEAKVLLHGQGESWIYCINTLGNVLRYLGDIKGAQNCYEEVERSKSHTRYMLRAWPAIGEGNLGILELHHLNYLVARKLLIKCHNHLTEISDLAEVYIAQALILFRLAANEGVLKKRSLYIDAARAWRAYGEIMAASIDMHQPISIEHMELLHIDGESIYCIFPSS